MLQSYLVCSPLLCTPFFSMFITIFQVFLMQTLWVQKVKIIKKNKTIIALIRIRMKQNAYQLQINEMKHINWYHWKGDWFVTTNEILPAIVLLDDNTFLFNKRWLMPFHLEIACLFGFVAMFFVHSMLLIFFLTASLSV